MTTSGTSCCFIRGTLLSELLHLALSLVLCPLYPVALIAASLPSVFHKLISRLPAKVLRADLDGTSDVSSQQFGEAQWSNNGLNIVIGVVVPGRLNAESIGELCEAQVLPLEEYRLLKAYPVGSGGNFYWRQDLDFNIRNHVRVYDGGVLDGSSSPTNGDIKHIFRELLGAPWKRNQKSLWEVLLLRNYFSADDAENKEEEKTVLLLRMQYIMLGDGYSLPGLPEAGLYSFLRFLSTFLGRRPGFYIVNDGRGNECQYLMTSTEGIPFEIVSEVRNKFRVSVQAVLNALVSGAMYRLLTELEHETPKNLTIHQPWYVPDHPRGYSNCSAPPTVTLPLMGDKDTARKVQLCHQKLLATTTQAVSPDELHFPHTKLWLHFSPSGESLEPSTSARKDPLALSFKVSPVPPGPPPLLSDEKHVGRLTAITVTTCTSLGRMNFPTSAPRHLCSDPNVLDKFNEFLLEQLQAFLKAKPLETMTVIHPKL